MFRLLAGGGDITSRTNQIAWETSTDTLGAQITFDSLYDLPEGEIVSTSFDGKEDIRAIIVGKVSNRFTYSYTALDFAHLLKNEVLKQFNDMPASEALVSLLGEYGVACRCCPIPTRITKLYKDSLTAILEDILSQAEADQGVTYVREMQADTLVIRRLSEQRIYPRLLLGEDLPVESSITELVNKVVVVSGGEENAAVLAVAQDAGSIARYGLRQVLQCVEDKDVAQAGNIARNILKQGNRILHTAAVTAVAVGGGEQVKANRMLSIKAGRLDGWYKIRSASHTLEAGKHMISIGLEW